VKKEHELGPVLFTSLDLLTPRALAPPQEPAPASVWVAEDAQILEIPRDALAALAERNPDAVRTALARGVCALCAGAAQGGGAACPISTG